MFIILAGTMLLSACSKNYEGDFSYEIEDFEFENQDGETVSNEDLKGTFWVADFIFTNCTTACPPMTANMAKAQEKIKEAGLEDKVRFVSFTIDPEYDTKQVLKDYIQKQGGDFSNWDALTGYTPERIKEFSQTSFKSLVDKIPRQNAKEDESSYDFLHSSSLFIVTPEGNAIKRFEGTQFENVDALVNQLKEYVQ